MSLLGPVFPMYASFSYKVMYQNYFLLINLSEINIIHYILKKYRNDIQKKAK